MALPSEPLDALLPLAVTIVLAEVLSVTEAPAPPRLGATHLPIGLGRKLPAATVRLRVERTLRGAAATEIEVQKPEGTYALVPGIKGPFLLDVAGHILGRHGPDSYSLAALTQVLGREGH